MRTSLDDGFIVIGWRKRVICIDWEDTLFRGLVTEDDVTKEQTMVHAWGYAKAVEYLTSLRRLMKQEKTTIQKESAA